MRSRLRRDGAARRDAGRQTPEQRRRARQVEGDQGLRAKLAEPDLFEPDRLRDGAQVACCFSFD